MRINYIQFSLWGNAFELSDECNEKKKLKRIWIKTIYIYANEFAESVNYLYYASILFL